MDLTTFLSLAVFALIVFSGYILFNEAPRLGGSSSRRRR